MRRKNMKTYMKPEIQSYSDAELMEIIAAGASCPNCYSCGTYNSGSC